MRSQFSIKWFLRDLFLSKYFYSDACLRKRIASPAEFVIGTTRMLKARMPATELTFRLDQMGQSLLAPPNVKGWDGEQAWIHSSSWAARLEFARAITDPQSDDNAFAPHFSPTELVAEDLKQPEAVVDRLSEVLMQGDLSAKVCAASWPSSSSPPTRR